MTEPVNPEPNQVNPSRRDRMRPAELLGFAAVLGIFAGLVVLFVLRDTSGMPAFGTAGIVAGGVFIVVLLIVALLGLGGKPSAADLEARKDLQSPDKDDWH